MKAYDTNTLNMIEAGEVAERDMLLIDLPSGIYGFWTGRGTLVYQSVLYQGSGSLIQVEPLQSTMGLSPTEITLRLSAIPDSELTPDVLATIELEQYHQRPATLSVAYIHPDTRAVISVERFFRGYIDVIDHEQQVGGPYTLVCKLESKSRGNMRRGYRMRGNADQRLVNANDGGLQYVGQAGEITLQWGRIGDRPVLIGDQRQN